MLPVSLDANPATQSPFARQRRMAGLQVANVRKPWNGLGANPVSCLSL